MRAVGLRSYGDASHRWVDNEAGRIGKAEWMEHGHDPVLSPTVFLVDQPPDTTIAPHFHRENQFQLFVDGEGKIGGHRIEPVTVHYAGAYTGYGPITAGASGLKYFTIRSVFDTGHIPVREARQKMLKGPRVGAQSQPVSDSLPDQINADVVEQTLIEPRQDGLAARACLISPGSVLQVVTQGPAQGHFLFVIAGSAHHRDGELTRWESIFVSSDEESCVLTAGLAGANVILLSIPRRDEAFPHIR